MGIKEKAEQGYYADENSATEYAADRISYAADRVKDEGIHQFNKQGQKAVKTTQENISKAKDKIIDFKQSRAVKAAEQKAAQNMSEQHGLQIRHGAASRSSATDVSQTAKSQLIKTRQQGQKMIKTTARNAEKAVKVTAKGTVKTTEKGIKTAQATSKAAIKTTETSVKTALTSVLLVRVSIQLLRRRSRLQLKRLLSSRLVLSLQMQSTNNCKDYFNYKYRAVLYGCPIFFYSIQVYSNLNLHV